MALACICFDGISLLNGEIFSVSSGFTRWKCNIWWCGRLSDWCLYVLYVTSLNIKCTLLPFGMKICESLLKARKEKLTASFRRFPSSGVINDIWHIFSFCFFGQIYLCCLPFQNYDLFAELFCWYNFSQSSFITENQKLTKIVSICRHRWGRL